MESSNNEPSEPMETESISEIQNYLDSFNKEIQTGSNAQGTSTASTTTSASSTTNVSSNSQPSTTYFVHSEANDGNQRMEYQSYNSEQDQSQFNEASGELSYYASESGEQPTTYYVATNGTNQDSQTELIQALAAQQQSSQNEDNSNNQAIMESSEQATNDLNENGLQQIVLAASQAEPVVTNTEDGEAQQISVALPASIVKSNQSQDQAGSQAEEQTVKMIVRQPDGTEQEQSIPLNALRTAAANQSSTSGATLMTTDGQEITIAPSGSTNAGPTLMTSDGQEFTIGSEETLQMMANIAEQSASGGEGNQQVILNSGNSYQTVTIVPSSESNQNEVSYVLIVSQDDKDGGKDNVDMSVYDFTEGAAEKGAGISIHEAHPDDPAAQELVAFTTKITPKKSQIVAQATHMCNYCNYTSPKRYLLSRHMKSHSEERPHKCSVCERGFKTLASLQNHVNTHTGTRPHQCKDCSSAFTTSGELVRHVRYRHTHEKPHRCTECDYASVELSKLKRHMRCHTGERPYQCPHCTYASPDTYKLKRHLRIHTGEKPYECEHCGAKFTQSNSLKAHRLIHTGNKPVFQCELCPTTCGRKTDLRIHVQKLHTADKPLECKRCGKSFPDRYTYKLHVKTHEGEKCFKCDLCKYASISQRHLESHMLIHTDQKPFICEQCDQCFRQKQLLKRHRNLYHNPNYVPPTPRDKSHECPDCGKAFRHKGNLIRHMAIHDPDATAAEKAEAVRYGRRTLALKQGVQIATVDALGQVHGVPISSEISEENQDGQVVVFEVIQLPEPNEGGESSIIETDAEISTIAAANESEMHQEDSINTTIDENHELVEPDLEAMKRKTTVSSNLDDDFEWNPPSDNENRDHEMIENSGLNEGKLAAVGQDATVVCEVEVQQKRAEQKQKDVDECFGFNDEDADESNYHSNHSPAPKSIQDVNAAFDETLRQTSHQTITSDEQALREIAKVVGDDTSIPSTFIVNTEGVDDPNATAMQLLAAMQEQAKPKSASTSQ